MSAKEKIAYRSACKIEDKQLRENAIRQIRISNHSTIKMNKDMIERWNTKVNPEDNVIYVGDLLFSGSTNLYDIADPDLINSHYLAKKLNGNISLFLGNHDKQNKLKTLIHSMVLKYKKNEYFVTHDPRDINFTYHINIVGHVHEKWKFCRIDKRFGKGDFGEYIINQTKELPDGINITDCINVSADVLDFYPRTLHELLGGYFKWRNEYEKEN